MPRFSRLEVYQTMCSTGIIPVFNHPDADICFNVAKACYAGGARLFEFTNRGNFGHEVFSILSKKIASELPEMALGAGSVVDAATASLYIQLGADFIVSPVLKEDMAKTCNRRKIAWIPGCGTLSEISNAEELGAEVVKIFPAAQIGGPEFIKNIKGPCPWTHIMPTGGVSPTEENLKAWFHAGAFCVGMGSKLILKKPDGTFDLEYIETKTRECISIIDKIRK